MSAVESWQKLPSEGAARTHDRGSIVAAKVGDGFEVGDKPAQQPHRPDMRWHSRFKRRDERISLK